MASPKSVSQIAADEGIATPSDNDLLYLSKNGADAATTVAQIAANIDYSNLTGTPTLGTAAATNASDYATAAQGLLADSLAEQLAEQLGELGTLAAVDDAPSDGNQYARQDGTWVETAATGGGTVDAASVAAAGAVMTSSDQTVAGVKTFSSAPLVPGPTSEFEAATKGYVDTTAVLDAEVDADIKTLSLPANTTISTFGASLIDDADAAAARTTLGVPAATTVAPTVVLTQAEYNALTPDSETIYYIVG